MKIRSPVESAKRIAAFVAGERHIFSGCKLGVGSGSTARYLVEFLEERIKKGLLNDIVCVPSSFLTRSWLIDAGLNVVGLDQVSELDLSIDGADEVDESLNCIKGGGGCLTREKLVQASAREFFLIADDSKISKVLGEKRSTIPIEVVPFGHAPVMRWIEQREGGKTFLRMGSNKCGPVMTDNNNYILDWRFPKNKYLETMELAALNNRLITLPGVVETGLFIDVVNKAYFASSDGTVIEKTKDSTNLF